MQATLACVVAFGGCGTGWTPGQRDEVSFLRGPYNAAFFWRHRAPFRWQAAIHYAHAVQHDRLQLTPLARHANVDARTDADYRAALASPPLTDPHMMLYGPHVGQAAWSLYLAIDWTHQLHEQTYDVMMSKRVPWSEKRRWTERTVRNYLARQPGIARSPAPLDVTMRRAGVMMKPYFTLFRNHYPASNDFFYVAHWWHPVIYEAVMIAGNDGEQEESVRATHALTDRVLGNRPQRMLLSREAMPRYARLAPEAANVFDNLHMLHGIAYDVLAYKGWTMDEKRREIERVVRAMAEQPGDDQLARRFALPYPDMDPRTYTDWMRTPEGDMTRIMLEMLDEMWPMMSPDGAAAPPPEAVAQARKKLTPGLQPGERDGSLMDALQEVVPGLRMAPETMQPGATPRRMVDAMLAGWQRKHGDRPEVAPYPMESDPALPRSVRAEARR